MDMAVAMAMAVPYDHRHMIVGYRLLLCPWLDVHGHSQAHGAGNGQGHGIDAM